MLAAVQLQVGELEVAFVAPRVGAHEGTLLAALRPDERRADAGNAPHVLPTSKKHFYLGLNGDTTRAFEHLMITTTTTKAISYFLSGSIMVNW